MKIKKKGEAGSAMSLVLIFVTIVGLAIASLIFVTQLSTNGVRQMSEGNKNSSDLAKATANVLAQFQKDKTLGTVPFDPTTYDPNFPTPTSNTPNCGLTNVPSINGFDFVSCLPIIGGGQFTTASVGTGSTDGTVFIGKFSTNNTVYSNSTIDIKPGSSLTAAVAQENVTCQSDHTCKGNNDPAVQTGSTTDTGITSDCATYEYNVVTKIGCTMPVSYWVYPHTTSSSGTSILPTPLTSCPTSSGITITLKPGTYKAVDVAALNTLTNHTSSSVKFYGKWNEVKYEDGKEGCASNPKITLVFSDGEFVFTGGTPLVFNNPNLTVRNSNTKVKMCTTGYRENNSKCANTDIDSSSQSWTHSGIKQFSCDYSTTAASTWPGPLSGPTTDANFTGSRIFFNGTDFDVQKGNVYLCGTNFPTSKVMNNFAILALDKTRIDACNDLLSTPNDTHMCPPMPSSRITINFASGAHVHIGGGMYVPNADLTTSETSNKHHTWDHEVTAKKIEMRCTESSGKGCEHNVERGELGRTVEVTFKKDGKFYKVEININEYDSRGTFRRIDDK